MASTCPDTTTTLDLPPELWCEMFKNVDPHTLRSGVSLTCRHFHSIARPSIFRKFYLFHHNPARRSHNSARLEFYASDAIAPHVRELMIFFRHGMQGPHFLEIVASFFNVLPRFLNTQSLQCSGMDLTASFFRQVATLLSLETLHVMECFPPLHTDLLPTLRPRTFICPEHADQGTDQLRSHHWLALLDPDHLQVLEIPLTQGACSFFLANENSSLHPFPSLHTITMNCSPDPEPLLQLPMFLSKIPALRCLQLFLDRYALEAATRYNRTIEDLEALESSRICSVPFLEQYVGPHRLLPVVLGGRTVAPQSAHAHLRHLFLRSIDKRGDPLDSFVNSLESCHPLQLRGVTRLYISLPNPMDLKNLTSLQDMLPALQELYLLASESYHNEEHWFNILLKDLYTLPLPRSLTSLSIQWQSVSATTDLPSLVTAKDNLLARLPSLCRLWLCDWSKLALLWSRNASGMEERCDHFEVASQEGTNSAKKMRAAVFPEEPEPFDL